MALPENKVTIGDGGNGILMYEGEIVYAYNSETRLKTVLGILRFSAGGTPYLSDIPFIGDFDFKDLGLPTD